MKKTLIALMALAGVASAALTLDKEMTGFTTSNFTYSWATSQSSAAVTLILGETAMSRLDSGYNNGWNEAFASFTLTNGKLGETTIGQITLENKYDGDIDPKAIRVSNTDLGQSWGDKIMKQMFAGSVHAGNAAWDTAEYAALTFAIDADGNASAILSTIDANGTITTLGSNTISTGVSFDGISGLKLNRNADNLDNIDTAYIYSGSWEASDLTTITNKALYALAPEPTTATLSLLALAGLAARRRRK